MTVYIIGAGCGDKGLLTSYSAEIIDKCGTVIGPERLAEKYADSEREKEYAKYFIDLKNLYRDALYKMKGWEL